MDGQVLLERIARGIKSNFPNLKMSKLVELSQFMEIQFIKKKEHIFKTGQYYGKIVFVVEGIFRAYYKKEETEISFWFREENTVFASHSSILAQRPSKISYQALEDAIVATIDYSLLKKMALDDNEVASSIIVVLEGLVLDLIERVEEYTTMTSEERYLNYIENYPNVVNRISQQDLASYIGITPVSFSRLKSRLMSK